MKKWGMFAMFALVAAAACSSNDNNDNNDNHANHENHENHDDKDAGNNNEGDSGGGGGEDSGNGGEDSGNGGEDSGNGGEDSGNGEDTSEPPTSDWTLTAHTCVGNRTDTMFCEDDQTCYVGCGTTTTGDQGYYVTTDGGATWSKPTTDPPGYFDAARVNSISKHGDLLYIAGGALPNSQMVVSVDASGTVGSVTEMGNQTWNGFLPGTYRRSDDRELVEAKNGTQVLYKEGENLFRDGGAFYNDGDADDIPTGVQIMDLEVYDGEFWGVGSLINQPPTVFTPKWTADDFDFGIVHLATGLGTFDGEQYGIDVDASGVVVGGVNQTRAHGTVYTLAAGDDPNDAANWNAFDVGSLFDGQKTWVHDVCRHGDTIYAVGRESAEGWGFVLKSEDGGDSFTDITPYDIDGNSELEDMYRCQAFEDGVIATGAAGQFIRNF